jgi:nucleoside-diphosphate-sugar epimerase
VQVHTLVTGSSGFLGTALVQRLTAEGYSVDTLARKRGSIVADLTERPPSLERRAYDVVYHLAGKAHATARTQEERAAFFAANVVGTQHLLSALEKVTPPARFVFVSTVAVYGLEAGEGLSEDTERAAQDPYGLSKRQAEDLVADWGAHHGISVSIVRLPLVAGRGAPGNLAAMVAAIRRGWYMGVGDGSNRRSIVDVSDVVAILPRIAERGDVFHLTDGVHPTFAEIELAIAAAMGRPAPPRIPLRAARWVANIGDRVESTTGYRFPLTSRALSKMTSTLTFNDARARRQLGWAPQPALAAVRSWV